MIDLEKINNIVVVGASNDQSKYGYKVLVDLKSKGYNVVPVNPKGGGIEDLKVYKKLADISKPIDLVVIITPPPITLQILKQMRDLKLNKVWLQPGAGDQLVQNFLDDNKFDYINNACVMVKAK